jgi:hypothetical protein
MACLPTSFNWRADISQISDISKKELLLSQKAYHGAPADQFHTNSSKKKTGGKFKRLCALSSRQGAPTAYMDLATRYRRWYAHGPWAGVVTSLSW